MKVTISLAADATNSIKLLDGADAASTLAPGESTELDVNETNGIQIDLGDAVSTEAPDPATISGTPEEIASRKDADGNPAPVGAGSPGMSPTDIEALKNNGVDPGQSSTGAAPVTNTADTNTGGQGSDTVAPTDGGTATPTGGAGDDTITAAPVAVVSTDPTIIQQVPGDTAPTAVIVTDHPNGDVLVTPVTGGDHTDLGAGDVAVDPTTGVPSVEAGSGVTLGDTAPATNQDATSSAADLAASDPTAVVSAPVEPTSDPAQQTETVAEPVAPTDDQVKDAIKAVAVAEDLEHEEVELEKTNDELAKQNLAPITTEQHEAAIAEISAPA